MKETDKYLKCRSCLSEWDSTLKSCPSWFFSFVLHVLDFFGPGSSIENIPKTNYRQEKRTSDFWLQKQRKITIKWQSRTVILHHPKSWSSSKKDVLRAAVPSDHFTLTDFTLTKLKLQHTDHKQERLLRKEDKCTM